MPAPGALTASTLGRDVRAGVIFVAAALLAGLVLGTSAARADWSGDGPADVLAIHPDGRLVMYRGNGQSGWITAQAETIGSSWGGFTALLAPGDFSGDGKPDLLVRDADGRLLMYRGNGAGGWATGLGQQVGAGWGGFTALIAPGDFSGDGKPDVLGRAVGRQVVAVPRRRRRRVVEQLGRAGRRAAGNRSRP